MEGEEDGWYKITSGSVSGYVKCEYVVTGAEGEALAAEVGRKVAVVTTTTLKVRKEPSLEAQAGTAAVREFSESAPPAVRKDE